MAPGNASLTTPRIGAKLKYARKLKGLRLVDVARLAGCSESLLSKLEHDKATPSLSMLHRLSQALGSNVAWFLTAEDETAKAVMRKHEHPVVDFDRFRALEGTQVVRLAPYFDRQLLQALLFIIIPGGQSLDQIVHEGEDFGLVLEGEIELSVGDEVYRLGAGDTFQFRSERPHGYRNPGRDTAKVLWINTPPTY